MRKPIFFVVGAPKCGTTSMYEYLREHPLIFGPDHKEPFFFASDIPGLSGPKRESDYLALFEDATDDHLAVGEASVVYLYSAEAPYRIREFNPSARVIAMVRNPIDLVRSFHQHLFFWGSWEDEGDLERAWDLQEARRRGERIPPHCPAPEVLQYSAIAKLGVQVERLLNIFPREQVKIALFDDLIKDTKATYEDLLAFLGVPSDGRTDFPVLNQGMSSRAGMAWLSRFFLSPSAWIVSFKTRVKRILGVRSLGLAKLFFGVHAKNAPRRPLDPEFRQRLVEEFREDLGILENIVGRDLSHWLTGN